MFFECVRETVYKRTTAAESEMHLFLPLLVFTTLRHFFGGKVKRFFFKVRLFKVGVFLENDSAPIKDNDEPDEHAKKYDSSEKTNHALPPQNRFLVYKELYRIAPFFGQRPKVKRDYGIKHCLVCQEFAGG